MTFKHYKSKKKERKNRTEKKASQILIVKSSTKQRFIFHLKPVYNFLDSYIKRVKHCFIFHLKPVYNFLDSNIKPV